MKDITIRKETEGDFEQIHAFVETAFLTANVSGGEERAMVESIHGSDKYIPELSLIAEQDGQIVGYIMLSKTQIDDGKNTHECLNLGPVCSSEGLRNHGIGGMLIKEAINTAREMGFSSVFLAGDRNYYGRFGFVPASQYNIRCQHDVPTELQDNIMALELTPNALEGISGTVYL